MSLPGPLLPFLACLAVLALIDFLHNHSPALLHELDGSRLLGAKTMLFGAVVVGTTFFVVLFTWQPSQADEWPLEPRPKVKVIHCVEADGDW